MNHNLEIDVAVASARYESYVHSFPQRKYPVAFKYDPTNSVAENLDNLALFALHHSSTLAVFHSYKPVFLELVARWIENTQKFEQAFCKLHSVPTPEIPGSTILLALSRVFPVFPECSSLVEEFLENRFGTQSFASASPSPADLHLVLLAIYRIYSDKPHRFARFISPQLYFGILSLEDVQNASKLLAAKILCQYLNASEASQHEMVNLYLKGKSLTGTYDGGHKTDYSFIDIVEAKRLSNFSKLPVNTHCSSSQMVTIAPSDLSQMVVSVCGVLVANTSSTTEGNNIQEEVVPTQNAISVLTHLAHMIQNNKPVMLYGQAGSGKTFLINQMAKYLSVADGIVKIHLGEQTDAKLLLGTYTSGEKPGSFEWRSGVLTTAVKEGKWVLVEDIDKAPTEVLSILLTLLEKRELSIPSRGEVIKAHTGFKLISTVRINTAASESTVPDMIGLRLWELIEVVTPSELELRSIMARRFPLLTNHIAKFITVYNKICHIYSMTSFISLNRGSHPRVISTRDLMKFCARCNRMLTNKGITSPDQLLESDLYENIFAEAVECFGSAITEYAALTPLVNAIGEILEVPTSRINLFLESYVPTFYADEEKIEIGRAVLQKSITDKALYGKTKKRASNFARTKHSKRLMEQIGVGIQMFEPLLLVGETGTGKTTVVQEIAKMMNKKLTVINVSQQTESGDLLGGYKPVNTKTIALPLQETFENLFLATFSSKKNAKFSTLLSKCFNRNQWKNVIKLWKEAVKMAYEILKKSDESDEELPEEGGPKKKRKLGSKEKSALLEKWHEFSQIIENFETQASNLDNSFVFSFVEGSLVKAVKNGDWLLLDEINLASPDTLESIADLLSETIDQRSVLLSERGDIEAIEAHPDFRIFGCMNPSTDVGKRDLPLSIRSRFTEIYVHSPDRDREDLVSIIEKYIDRYSVGDEWAVEDIAELYYEAKNLASANKIVDGANQKPHFSIRTLTRTLTYVRDIVSIYGLRRALYEGFCMSFLTLLDIKSESILKPIIAQFTIDKLKNAKHIVSRCPPAPAGDDEYVQFKHYWLKRGPGEITTPNYIITPFVEKNLLNLVRATASRKFPVLVQGPTSAGKTSMISYLASITGHKFVRINNHEHTDLQEYLGTYISDSSGKLVFREGVLVEALRKGYWIVLDELNLAPTDVLEALNRLLDDNRELFIPETQEVITPHPDFMLFATQNPPGLYGGRKILSRAFRNRFLELHFDDIPQDELEIILKERCQIAPSYGKKIVEVYKQLSVRRQSSRLFEQKNSFATLRDLFRWALREAVGYEELAANGYMLLAERVRSSEEKAVVKEAIEKVMRVKLDMDAYYQKLENHELMAIESSIVWTKAMKRLAVLVEMSIKYKEPLLLVGETGCGKTTICQILALLLKRELITVNAHQNTETGDILGAQRPLRNRFEIRADLFNNLLSFFSKAGVEVSLETSKVDELVKKYESMKQKVLSNPEIDVDEKLTDVIDEHIKNSAMLFEWVDGPLIQAMKTGDFFLLDEISLADDSVLERLNSVLEPERSLLLAEKGTEDAFLVAQETFQFLATMNPGGDYGKKELSPALRNRFTEVWVPSMEDFEDVRQIVTSRLTEENKFMSGALVQFSEWFGKRLGNGNANSGVISLRDILAWVEFINSCSPEIPRGVALLHGAMMVFIDALGTNNTAYLAENEARLAEYKQECANKLIEVAGTDIPHFEGYQSTVEVTPTSLKAGLFEIPRSVQGEWKDSFNLQAPTTAANAMRVLRAMQVNKPILLEGSPGVGKTSLISAISKATGRPLIRINLSEQTDLIDLFGSDAPVEGANTGEFVWRDAPFLRAMKNGEWVLLDEMNLASQSVLEGLNACLDHRGEAYIPELDRSFPRHPDFKVFAAQNPQYQGGGRKGLPKSFVNRFSVVYMDVLKKEDLMMISRQVFPEIPADDCDKVIDFMSQLEEQVTIKKKWGLAGGPWEFNLRDTLRWLSLYSSGLDLGTAESRNISDYLDMIICQRFRTADDRAKVKELFESVFGAQETSSPYFALGDEYVQSGKSILPRSPLLQYPNSSDRVKFISLQTNFSPLESAMRSVKENIPLILTGPTNSGKTELIRYIANVVGVKLTEFAMNSDVDSMDILGGYEQVDLTRAINDISSSVLALLNELVVINLKVQTSEANVLTECLKLIDFIKNNDFQAQNFKELLARLEAFTALYSNDNLHEMLVAARELNTKLQKPTTVKFNWFDGLLVKAVTNGDWLVLDNANLCNPSVLDRLNSLLETNGSLIINECSQEDGSPRVLVPHPNFRLFLTVDPKYGELSRAMRNRCVEIYLESLDKRATSFDKKCLGIMQQEVAEGSIDVLMENLHVDELASTRPLSAFISSTDSLARPFVLIHDSIESESQPVLCSALVGLYCLSGVDAMKKWRRAVSAPEFTANDVAIVEEVLSTIQLLHKSKFTQNLVDFYSLAKESGKITNSFIMNQTFAPHLNSALASYFAPRTSGNAPSEVAMLFQVAAGNLLIDGRLEYCEKKATHGKLSELSFIEKSCAVGLGRELKKAPKVNIYAYLKAISTFLSNVFVDSMQKDAFLKSEKLYECLIELQCIWSTLFDSCKEANISKLRVYYEMISTWLEEHSDYDLIHAHSDSITSLNIGLDLTSGLSMVKIWEKFRQAYPGSDAGWNNYINFMSLLSDFDVLSKKLYPDTFQETSIIRESMIGLYDEIVAGSIKEDDLESIFANFTSNFKRLAEVANSFSIERNNSFEEEFTMLSNFLEIAAYSEASNDRQLSLANYSSKTTMSLINSSKEGLFLPYPRIFDSLWSKDVFFEGMFTNKLLVSSLKNSQATEGCPGKFLDQKLADMKVLGNALIEDSDKVLQSSKDVFRNMLLKWFVAIVEAHDIHLPPLMTEFISENQVKDALTLIASNCDEALIPILEAHFFPALHILSKAETLTQLGKAWVLFSSGCIQLFVPNSPLDPAIEEHVSLQVVQEHQKLIEQLVASWKIIGNNICGQDDLAVERGLPQTMEIESSKSKVYRTNESIDVLFDEWNAFMESSIDVEPIKKLLEAAENLSTEVNSQKLGLFHKNAANFMMRLKSSYLIYADLNEILDGYIYGIRLGLSLMESQHKNDSADFQLNTLSQLEVNKFMNCNYLSNTFSSIKEMNKQLGSASVLSEKLMAFFVKLCFAQRKISNENNVDEILGQAFQSLYYRWYYRKMKSEELAAQEGSLYKHEDTDDAEKEFKELFPDYEEVMELDSEVAKRTDLFDDVYFQIAESYVDHYLGGSEVTLHSIVAEGASLCGELKHYESKMAHSINTSSQLSALLLSMNSSHEKFSAVSHKEISFYHEPNPAEFRRAMTSVISVYKAAAQLLLQWPEHATLQNIVRISDEFLSYPSSFPLDKLLHKVENIFNLLNEWEKFASSQVTLKAHYEELTSLIVSWRRLELSSWKSLFHFEDMKCKKSIGKWWFHLFESIIIPFMQEPEAEEDEKPSVLNILTALNIFMSETTFGEFGVRLDLIKSFRNHIFTLEYVEDEIRNGLANFVSFYEQFLPHITETIQKTKKTLEKDISEVILLASWKDVNIDALRESSRKSHNNLYKIVRKYRMLLSTQVAPLVQNGIPKDTPILLGEHSGFENKQIPEQSKDEKLATLKICTQVASWADRPNRLKNIDLIEKNLKIYVDRITNSRSPLLFEYAKEVIGEMERLKSETPSVMNDETKKTVAALKTQKYKLLSDTFKELRRVGVKTSAKTDVKKALATVNLSLANSATFGAQLKGTDAYYFRCLELMPRLKGAISGGHPDVPQPDLERGLAVFENLMFNLLATRKPVVELATSVTEYNVLLDDFKAFGARENEMIKATLVPSIDFNMKNIKTFSIAFTKIIDYAQEVVDSVAYLHVRVDTTLFAEIKSKCVQFMSALPAAETKAYFGPQVTLVEEFRTFVVSSVDRFRQWGAENSKVAFVSEIVLEFVAQASYKPFLNSCTSLAYLATVEEVEKQLRSISNGVILSVQKIVELHKEEISSDIDGWLQTSQQRLMKSLKLLHLKTITANMKKARELINHIEHTSASSITVSSLLAFTIPLLSHHFSLAAKMLESTRRNFIDISKSTYVLSKSLHTLATEGFCSPEGPSEQKKDDNLHDGTGLGDGEGATNNSKDEEEDDDLAEHAQQPNEEKNENEEDDENDDAVDMQGDMAGDLEEASDQDKDDDEDDEDEEDLDEEVDDIDDLDPNAIDEKMWDEEAKEDEKEKDSDKMPQNAMNDDDNMEANEDENDEKPDADDKKDEEEGDIEENEEGEDGEEEDVGEQEDEVKNEENEALDEHVPETETLDLPEDMNLDDEDDGEDDEEEASEYEDNMDVDEENKDDKPAQEEDNGEEEEVAEDDAADEDGNAESGEEDEEQSSDEDAENNSDAEVDENPQELESDVEDLQAQQEQEPQDDSEEEQDQKGGEDAVDGDEGAENNEENEDVDMDAATKNNAGDQGEGADNQATDEQDNIGTTGDASTDLKQEEQPDDAPSEENARDEMKESLKQLGDSLKEFHRRRQEIKEASLDKQEEQSSDVKPDEFQHVDGENTEHDTQALGSADNKDQVQPIDDDMAIDEEQEPEEEPQVEEAKIKTEEDMEVDEAAGDVPDEAAEDADDFEGKTQGGVVGERREIDEDPAEGRVENQDLDATEAEQELEAHEEEEYVIKRDDMPAMELDEARDLWRHSEVSTLELASGLSEQLRLILEPTLATKLRGDYKTGKRLNMKRIISYIASDFRKDKIWLRRTKPAKRQYQIMIAVDDSKSMKESNSTELAFHSIALVSKALTQLESGELSIVRFGEDVKLVHPFNKPFTQETGANVFRWFDFQQERTDIKQLCSKSLKIFENARATSSSDLWQLQIIISDGVCEDHATVQRLVRKAREEKVMLVFVVVDGINSNESILDMSQVSYVPDPVTGAMSLKVENYLDTFPFEFYVVVRNINELPEMLSLILRQYFSEVANY